MNEEAAAAIIRYVRDRGRRDCLAGKSAISPWQDMVDAWLTGWREEREKYLARSTASMDDDGNVVLTLRMPSICPNCGKAA